MATIELVQISDCHLLAGPGARLKGVDTEAALAAVVADVAAGPAPAAVLVTGDLTQDGEAASYHRFAARAAALPAPVYALPGNHDDPAMLAAVLPDHGLAVVPRLRLDGWDVLMLDSTVPGSDDGALGEARLGALEARLAEARGRHVLVALHHQPVVVGGAWDAVVSLADAEALFAVLDRHDNVRAVVWGHIHQPYEGRRGTVRLMGAPATCFQFARDPAGGLGVGPEPSGYRRLGLGADGSVIGTVVWVPR